MFGFDYAFPNFPAGTTFPVLYKCFSPPMLGDREDVERGGKIIMPPSALDLLIRLNIQCPMLFKLKNKKTNRETHCGVLEFVADEGHIYIPYWMMQNLHVDEGEYIQIDNVSLAVATYVKFQPQSVDFLDITNPKAVLENALRNFACLTEGDVIAIKYNDKEYELCVLESKPGEAVSIIEWEMKIDFAPPVGYKEPERKPKPTELMDSADIETDGPDDVQTFRPFAGQGNRLDGRSRETEAAPTSTAHMKPVRRGIPNYNFKQGTITFIRNVQPVANGNTKEGEEKHFEAFSGQGQMLKSKNQK